MVWKVTDSLDETHDTTTLRTAVNVDVRSMVAVDEGVEERIHPGELMGVSSQARPDIATTVRAVARQSHDARMKAAIKTVQCVRETRGRG